MVVLHGPRQPAGKVNEKEGRDDHRDGDIGAAHGDEIRRLHSLVCRRVAGGEIAQRLRQQCVGFRRQHRRVLGVQRTLFAAEGLHLEFAQYVI